MVAKRGRSLGGTLFRIKWVPAPDNLTRFTVVTGLVIDKRSTVRNRLKRRTRELARAELARVKNPAWIMIFPNKSAIGKEFEHLQQELRTVLIRAQII